MGKYLFQLAVALAVASLCLADGDTASEQQVYQQVGSGRLQGAYVIEEPIISAGNDKNFQSVVIVEAGSSRHDPPRDPVGHQLFGSQQLDRLLLGDASARVKTQDVGHKLLGDRQFGQLEKASRINVEKVAPSVEIDAIVRPPKTPEPGLPSGRRLVSSSAYDLAPSALPLVSALPHDSARLQVLSEIPHRVYIHPPKVYPITPSPELSGPLLGGPRLAEDAVEKRRPFYGRALDGEDERARTFREFYFQPMMSYPMVRPGYRGNLFAGTERKYNAYYPYRQ